MSLTVIVPFYNEENTLFESVSRLVKCNIADQIFLVNDGSTDNSLKIANRLVNANKNITLFNKKFNTGKGSSINFVLNAVRTEFILVHDGDLEQNPNDIENLYSLSITNSNTLVIGSRVTGDLKRNKRYGIITLANFLFSALFSSLHNIKITDISSGYIVIPLNFIKTIKLEEEGFGFEIEILSKFLKTNKSIIEYPITYSGRKYSEGKKIKFKDGLNIFIKIFKYRF